MMQIRRCFLVIGLVLGAMLGLTAIAATQNEWQVVLNYVDAAETASEVNLQLYFTVKDGQGNVVIEPAIGGDGAILLDGQSYPAEISVPDENNPLFVVLTLDVSGSMEGIMGEMQEAAVTAVGNAPPGASLAVVTFNEVVNVRQGFTDNREQVASTIRGLPSPVHGTCLYDATKTAVDLVINSMLSSPRARGAVILFTDGRDELTAGQGDTCSSTPLEAVLNAPVPIYTIGLLGDNGVNGAELEQIALETNGLAAIGQRDNLPTLFREIMLGLNSQLVASSHFCAPAGDHTGILQVPFEDGKTASVSVPFQSTLTCTAASTPLFPRMLQADIVFDQPQQLYTVNFVIENSANVEQWQVRIIHGNGNTVLNQAFDAITGETVQFSAQQLEPNTKYRLEFSALGRSGIPLADEGGHVILWEKDFATEPVQLLPVSVSLEEFAVDRDNGFLRSRLRVQNDDPIAAYTARLISEDPNINLDTFPVIPDANQAFEISLVDIPEGKYRVVIEAVDGNGQVLAEAEQNIIYERTSLSFLDRVRQVLSQWPWLLALLILLLIGLVGFFLWRSHSSDSPAWPTANSSSAYTPPIHKTQYGGHFPATSQTAESFFMDDEPAKAVPQVSALLHIVRTPSAINGSQMFAINRTTFDLGREGCDVNIPDDALISRRHARIDVRNGQFFIEDLGSTNGTFINGRRLLPNTPEMLESGSEIGLGRKTSLRFEEQ